MANVSNVLSIPRALRVFARATIPASCSSSDAIGNSVFISGDIVGRTYTVSTADPSDLSKMPAVGVIWKKDPSSLLCSVRLFGELKDVYTGLTPGLPLYVGLDSRLTHTPPTNPGGAIYTQQVGWAIASNVPFLWAGSNGGGGLEPVYQRPLTGVRDGSNTSYTTPEKFLPETIRVYRNGTRQQRGAGLDFTLLESGGPGSGYDTIVFGPESPPISVETLFADYTISV